MPRTPVPDPVPEAPAGVDRHSFAVGWRRAWATPAKAARLVVRAEAGELSRTLRNQAVGAAHGLARRARCQKCGRELRDPLSVARNVGPDCWEQGYRATLVDGTGTLS